MQQTSLEKGLHRIVVGHVDPSAIVKAVCNYAGQRRKLRDFLLNFEETETGGIPNAATTNRRTSKKAGGGVKTVKVYRNAIESIAKGSKILEIKVGDILKFFGHDGGIYEYKPGSADKALDVINTVVSNTQRTLRLLYEVVEELRKELCAPDGGTVGELQARVQERIAAAVDLPMSFRVHYEIRLIPPASQPPLPIFTLRSIHVGGLNKVEGIVSKITNVKPSLSVAVYKCDACGNFEFQHIERPTFTPLVNCTSQSCKSAKRRDTLVMNMRDSKFLKRQEAKLQELPHLVPPGSVPRQLRVVVQGELTNVLRPGLAVTIGGIFLPVVEHGYRHPKASTASATIMEVHHIEPHRSSFGAFETSGNAQQHEIEEIIKSTPDLYEKLAGSIAPAIHGHEDVKKVLLLQLVGGTSETFGDGLKIRGDIHVLLMGDPGIAKSQLLLRVCAVAPRAHFTCGKGASGVGLTASVVKDPVTGEFTLEGGAIVMADNGVCCVDEFDKMPEYDRTAIHEVMEQQTVSISKAGLVATLNARTTILAAANPVFGRYDLNKSAVANIDQGSSYEKDLSMARYLMKIHKDKKVSHVEGEDGHSFLPLAAPLIRALICKAKGYNPKISKHLAEEIAEKYVALRRRDRQERGSDEENTYTTPRTLFGLLRMSQAVAKLRFSDTIDDQDFQEALRLSLASKQSVYGARMARGNLGGVADIGSTKRKRMIELLNEMAREQEVANKRRGGKSAKSRWINFMDAVRRAEDENLEAGLVEEVVDNLVHVGTMLWDGPAKKRFMFEQELDA